MQKEIPSFHHYMSDFRVVINKTTKEIVPWTTVIRKLNIH